MMSEQHHNPTEPTHMALIDNGQEQEFSVPEGLLGFPTYQHFVLSRYQPEDGSASPFYLLHAKEAEVVFPPDRAAVGDAPIPPLCAQGGADETRGKGCGRPRGPRHCDIAEAAGRRDCEFARATPIEPHLPPRIATRCRTLSCPSPSDSQALRERRKPIRKDCPSSTLPSLYSSSYSHR